MFLEIFLLALAIAGASCEAAPGKGTYKRMLFTAQVWPSFVYKVAPAKCQRPVDCVGLCSLGAISASYYSRTDPYTATPIWVRSGDSLK